MRGLARSAWAAKIRHHAEYECAVLTVKVGMSAWREYYDPQTGNSLTTNLNLK
jgi:hypothetical protein